MVNSFLILASLAGIYCNSTDLVRHVGSFCFAEGRHVEDSGKKENEAEHNYDPCAQLASPTGEEVALYKNLIITLVLMKEDPPPKWESENTLVQLIVAYEQVCAKKISFEQFGERMAGKKNGCKALILMDDIVVSDPDLRQRWFANFDKSPFEWAIKHLILSIKVHNEGALQYLLNFGTDPACSDGYYGEEIVEMFVRILIEQPDIVLANFKQFRRARKFISESVVSVAAKEEIERIRDIYKARSTNPNSREILKWLLQQELPSDGLERI